MKAQYYSPHQKGEKKCNSRHVKLVSYYDVATLNHSSNLEFPSGAFQQFLDSIQQNASIHISVQGSSPKPQIQPTIKDRDHKYTFA